MLCYRFHVSLLFGGKGHQIRACGLCSTFVQGFTTVPRSSLYFQRACTSMCLLHAGFSYRTKANARTKLEQTLQVQFGGQNRGICALPLLGFLLLWFWYWPVVLIWLEMILLSAATMASTEPVVATMVPTGLTTVFTPQSACLSTYVLDSWVTFGIDGDTTGTSLYYLVGDFQVRSSIIEGKRAFACTPQGGILLGIPYFSPGLSCPLGWTTQPPEADDGTTTTVYCCPRYGI